MKIRSSSSEIYRPSSNLLAELNLQDVQRHSCFDRLRAESRMLTHSFQNWI